MRPLVSLTAAALAIAVAPVVASAGAPWISIELPGNPMNPATRDAFLIVHTYYHATQVGVHITGHAIGIVDGKRQTMDLTLTPVGTSGVYALKRSWPTKGSWVLTLSLGEANGPTAIVAIGADGELRSVKVPTQTNGNDRWGRPVTQRDIDDALQSVASANTRSTSPAAAGLIVALPLVLGAAWSRRRR
jgi:hypothetical protein